MRAAVPSSKVGSCDSASAAAERCSGVEVGAAAVLAAAGWAGLAPVVTEAAGAGGATCASTGVPASVSATARIIVLCMIFVLGRRACRAEVGARQVGASPGIADESCVLIKWLLSLMH